MKKQLSKGSSRLISGEIRVSRVSEHRIFFFIQAVEPIVIKIHLVEKEIGIVGIEVPAVRHRWRVSMG